MAKFKKGDKAVITKLESTLGGFEVGDEVVIGDYPSYIPQTRPDSYAVYKGDRRGYADATSLRPVNPFKVGDIVTATEGAPYYITDEDMTKGKVIEVYHGDIRVKVLEHKTMPHEVGATYYVDAKHFELVDIARFKVGDKVASLMDGEVFTLKARRKDVDGDYGAAWSVEEYSFGWVGEDQVKLVGPTTRKYDDKLRPQVGDKVKVVSAFGTEGQYANGDVLTISEIASEDDGRFFVEENDRPIRDFEVELLERKAEDIVEEADFAKLKAGDKVRGIRTGSIYTLKERLPDFDTTDYGPAWRVEEDGWIGEKQVELIEEEPKLQVGDIVTGTPESSRHYGITTADMTKGEVIEVNDGEIRVKVLEHRTMPGTVGETYYVDADYFVKVGEVEKVEEESLEEALVKAMQEAVQSVLKERGLA